MPLGLSEAAIMTLASGRVTLAAVAEIVFSDGPARWTDGGHDIEWDGATWSKNNVLMSVTLPTQASRRGLRQMRLSDPKGDWAAKFDAEGEAGLKVRIVQVFKEPTGWTALSAYKGVTDQVARETEDGRLVTAVQCCSKFVKLDSQPRVSTSHDYASQFKGDTSMEIAHQAQSFTWHKAQEQ